MRNEKGQFQNMREDLTGRRFEKLVAMNFSHKDKNRKRPNLAVQPPSIKEIYRYAVVLLISHTRASSDTLSCPFL